MTRREPLKIHDATPDDVTFTTSLNPPATADMHELDKARIRIRRWGTTYVGPHCIDQKDLTELHQAIREARPVPACDHDPICLDPRDCGALACDDAAINAEASHREAS